MAATDRSDAVSGNSNTQYVDPNANAAPAPIELSDDAVFVVDGQQLSGKDLRAQRLMHADYTRKTQTLAGERRQYEAASQLLNSLQTDPQGTLAQLASHFGGRTRGVQLYRRGQRWNPPWPFQEPPPPELPARFLHLGCRQDAPTRRGSRWNPPWPFVEPPPPERPPRWQTRQRVERPGFTVRGHRWEPPFPTPPELPPEFLQAQRRDSLPSTRRGQWFSPPWVEEPGDPGAWTPLFLRGTAQPVQFRRGQYWGPSWGTDSPPPPPPPPAGVEFDLILKLTEQLYLPL